MNLVALLDSLNYVYMCIALRFKLINLSLLYMSPKKENNASIVCRLQLWLKQVCPKFAFKYSELVSFSNMTYDEKFA